MKVITVNDYADMSKKAANMILERVHYSKKLTLGLATGGTPVGTYEHLIKDHKENKTSYQHVTSFNLDEYVGLDPSDRNSYHYYMNEHLFNHIDIPEQQTHIPNGIAENVQQECNDYDQKIMECDGIDLQLLGLGHNGHIGFNEPGTSFETTTHVVSLTKATREANARFFNSFDEVPTQAITMGIQTIMKSKEILLLVSGKKKSSALARLVNGEMDTTFPASILNKHANVTIVADHDALQEVDEKLYSMTK
ncbi:glucosamine-6-phosphate deaminase [Aquibacillus albus]|uniref:Glucosamine-6-phosphate deaminase n=1 Tax=Aquibacillus albus TaxID=1168171 RepID=A0ABS2MZU2_9BACI|nr:glucosamine-6-phosphate deaminase [Aquibacillus albus]MBM7571313.1 glucosamine-6-phosphate deaminase [Aquibacillus albus]